MITHESVILHKIGGGRAGEVQFGRFLSNPKVTVEAIVTGWSMQTAQAAVGRHVLAIQDTSEIGFKTAEQRACLGKIGKGNQHGVLLHAMLAVDAETDQCLGLVAGEVWTREGLVATDHHERALDQKESRRWLSTAQAAQTVLAHAARVTIIADRESDIYDEWAWAQHSGADVLIRAAQDRRLDGTGKLFSIAADWPEHDRRMIEVSCGPKALRQRRQAEVALRFGPVVIRRPKDARDRSLPETVSLHLVDLHETGMPPAGEKPVVWRLLTTHPVTTVAHAWQMVDWYRKRWLIEQLFRTLKQQGLRVEDSQVTTPDALCKLVATAAKAAVITLMLVQARDGRVDAPARAVFDPTETAALHAIGPTLEGRTAKQKNPHTRGSLAWASWIIARLGGWTGYARERPPGPKTFLDGLRRFQAIALGYSLRDLCMP